MLDAHHHPRAVKHYSQDMAALARCGRRRGGRGCPFGLSAGMELGYAVRGQAYRRLRPAIREADLMLKMADAWTTNFEEVLSS